MLGDTLGDTRARAIYRLVFFLANLVTGGLIIALVGFIGGVLGLVYMLLDVLYGLVLDGDVPLSEDGAMSWWMWPIDMMAWTLFGDRDFPWAPY
ncbi:hypothetical protein [Halopenitus persicus]|uniref:hypothetical protein n=1 Tax=Halopenitus persicus TaxID=1048396 RepID=UPI0012FDFF9A|nr:hypothetical protein [Halopenitus persicus]